MNLKLKRSDIQRMTTAQLQKLLREDFESSPYLEIDQINDYMESMTPEEHKQEQIAFWAMEELASRRMKKNPPLLQ